MLSIKASQKSIEECLALLAATSVCLEDEYCTQLIQVRSKGK
jgi:hypothetical protein